MSSLTKKTMRCKPENIIVGNLKENACEIREYLYTAMAGHEGNIYSPPHKNTVDVMEFLLDE
ncbi:MULTISPECIES: hypothetical protein [Citrobacter]|uniref:hypothetical protein n=1 Tax=Citrobacter TaxID=544 RepID=UPI001956B585|nr:MULTISPECIES: hypothetical protein [Citrobacter]ELQ2289858.1 hypothetical protein [Escherichia coli]MDS0976194.1 hypothetical protein [Citrobacter portucalensis]MDT7467618.1 hypothetical protein [Citrobacter portucalensis]QRQ77018.1 hypothetical protein JQN59_26735 [Citrobacter sp. B72]